MNFRLSIYPSQHGSSIARLLFACFVASAGAHLMTGCAASAVDGSDGGSEEEDDSSRRDTGGDEDVDEESDADDVDSSSDTGASDADDAGTEDVRSDAAVEPDAVSDDVTSDVTADASLDTASDGATDVDVADVVDAADASSDSSTDTVAAENCGNGDDDDGDRATDCADLDCLLDPACEVETGAGTCADPIVAVVGEQTAVPAVDEQEASCLSITQNEAVFAFTPPTSGSWCLSTVGGAARDTILSVRTACGDVSTELFCKDDAVLENDSRFEQQTVPLTAGTRVFVIVDTYESPAPTGPTPAVQLQITAGACGGGGGLTEDLGLIDCTDNLDDIAPSALVGTPLRATCPDDCLPDTYFIIGSDTYRDSSWVCPAARHAGAVTLAGGSILLTVVEPLTSYTGSTRNGVTTNGSPIEGERAFTVAAVP